MREIVVTVGELRTNRGLSAGKFLDRVFDGGSTLVANQGEAEDAKRMMLDVADRNPGGSVRTQFGGGSILMAEAIR